MGLVNATVAMTAAAGGSVMQFAAAAEVDGGSSIALWVQGLSSLGAVGGLVYVAKMIVKGELVPRPVANYEAEIKAQIQAAADREAETMKASEEARRLAAKFEELFSEARAREISQVRLQADTTRALQAANRERGLHED